MSPSWRHLLPRELILRVFLGLPVNWLRPKSFFFVFFWLRHIGFSLKQTLLLVCSLKNVLSCLSAKRRRKKKQAQHACRILQTLTFSLISPHHPKAWPWYDLGMTFPAAQWQIVRVNPSELLPMSYWLSDGSKLALWFRCHYTVLNISYDINMILIFRTCFQVFAKASMQQSSFGKQPFIYFKKTLMRGSNWYG